MRAYLRKFYDNCAFCHRWEKVPFLLNLYRRHSARRNLGESLGSLPYLVKTSELRILHAEVVLFMARRRLTKWWDYAGIYTLFRFDNVSVLRRILAEFVLRRGCDPEAYMRFTRRLNVIAGESSADDQALLAAAEAGDVPQAEPVADNPPSCLGVLGGLLALYQSEKCIDEKGAIVDLRAMAQAIAEEIRLAPDMTGDDDQIGEIARLLWLFDMLPQAAEFLARFPQMQPLHGVITHALHDQKANNDWARNWRTHHPGKEVHVLGITIWGSAYIDFLLDYYFACLLADGNVPALARRGAVVISLVTDAAGEEQIRAHALTQRLMKYASVRFTVFAEAPTRATPELARQFYRRYGLLDHTHVYLARALAVNLYMMPSDSVFSAASLSRLYDYLAQGYDCCSVANIESDKQKMEQALEGMKEQDGTLSLAPRALLNLAARFKTEFFRAFVFAPEHKPIPYPREFFWRVNGGYICHSIYLHPLAVSQRALCSPTFYPNHENIDWAMLPRALQGGDNIKVLEDATEVTFVHCNQELRPGERGPYSYKADLKMMQYLLGVHTEDYPVHRRYCFAAAQFFPCEDTDIPVSSTYLTDIAFMKACFAGIR